MTTIKSLMLNQKLALLAFLLGLLALFAGSPYRGSNVTLDAQELAQIVDSKTDHVTAMELADWIMNEKADYQLIDIRPEKEYAAYHIPTAQNIATTALAAANLPRTEKIVIYSEGGIHSAQAWMLLRSKGYKAVYILFGGLEEWNDRILYPRLSTNATAAQQAEFAKLSAISKHFGGAPQSGVATSETMKRELPKPVMSGGSTPAPASGGKKKKEGC